MLKSNFRHSLFTDTFSNFRVNFEKKFAKIFSFFLMPKDEIDNVVGKKFFTSFNLLPDQAQVVDYPSKIFLSLHFAN